MKFKTYTPKEKEIKPEWYLIDAKDKILGRVATQIALILRGKDEAGFAPHLNPKHFVVVINASKVKFTGKKFENKKYFHHSGYPGGLKEKTLEELFKKNPSEVLRKAVKGMLPKNRLSKVLLSNLKVFPDESHPFSNIKFKKVEI